MAKRLMYIEGIDGQVELLTDRVIIHRKGWWNIMRFGFGAKREIPIAAIAEVVFRDANPIMFGRIEFVRAGRSQDERRKDYSAVKFRKVKQPEFVKLKEMIFDMVDQYAKRETHA
ncbi:MAG: hypothetical protein SFT92_07290 [Rickettsiales bacterium]|nr:hypothetical protein [Rickettsiales bacterium]